MSNEGFSSIINTGPGVYQLTLAAPPVGSGNIIPQLTPVGQNFAVVVGLVAGVITVNTGSLVTNVLANVQFYVSVVDNS